MNKYLISILLCLCACMGIQAQEEPSDGGSFVDDESSLRHYTVRTAAEFLAALGSNRVVTLAPGTKINLSDALKNRTLVEDNGCVWRDDFYTEREMVKCELIVSSDVYDGRQLELVNVSNLIIRGTQGCTIVVEPRYADVLHLYECVNVTLENLTMGHTYDGECAGGVVYCENCANININNCDLYGCGTVGLIAYTSNNVQMQKSIIRDCTEGVMELHTSIHCSFVDCDFLRCKDYSQIFIDEHSQSTKFVRCRFAGNTGTLFSIHSAVGFESCEIHHAKGNSLGNVADGYIEYLDDNTRWLRDDETLSYREIGPK